jgi:protoheme ferro-lyase
MRNYKGKIVKVLEKDGITPKHQEYWGESVFFYDNFIPKHPVFLLRYEVAKVIRTSRIEKVEHKDSEIIFTTNNSIFFITKESSDE